MSRKGLEGVLTFPASRARVNVWIAQTPSNPFLPDQHSRRGGSTASSTASASGNATASTTQEQAVMTDIALIVTARPAPRGARSTAPPGDTP